MGYSLPAAIGARAALPDTQIVAVCGDGAFQMSMMEMATMRQWNLPVKFVILKNDYLGLVREYQHHTYDDHYSVVKLDGNPDFELLAQAYGIRYFHLCEDAEMEETIDTFLAAEGSAMMVIEVDSYDLVKE
jgi:acetolactate synthase-1/2/3 large subunit